MYNTSKYYSYIFYADRNVRSWTILGYTLATFPKVVQYIYLCTTQEEIRTLAQLQEKGPCNGVETAEQECCWDLLELPMTQSSVKVEFISTCPPDDRVFIAKNDAILQEISPDCEDIKVAGNVDRYAKHPLQFKEWCLADYEAQLDVKTMICNTVQQDTVDSSSQEDESTTLFAIHLGNNKLLYKRRESKII